MIASLTVMLFALAQGQPAPAYEPVERIARVATVAMIGAAPAAGTEAQASVDPALRLPACPTEPTGVVANAGSVEVRCDAPAGWRLYVPVKVRRVVAIAILRNSVAPGQPIDPQTIAMELRDVTTVGGEPVTDLAALGPQVARRALSAGQVLRRNDLAGPRLIRRGDPVTLVVRDAGFEVRAPGRALGDAAVADGISVENLSSRRIVQGVVEASGDVVVRH